MIIGQDLTKIYKIDQNEIIAVNNLNFKIVEGEMVSIIGDSGSGKSTLLNMLGSLEKPSFGTLQINGIDMRKINNKELVKYKRETVGFVWQNNARNLLPYLTAIENVEVPMLLNGKLRKEWANEILERVGLSNKKNNKLNQLSGGEQQRVALAIGLANQPKILLADEPTGSVDSNTSKQIVEVLKQINKALGITIVIVTHDISFAKETDRVFLMKHGRFANASSENY